MPIFKYKAIDSTGLAVESTQNAASREQMIEIIRSRGAFPVLIEEYKDKGGLSLEMLKPKVKSRDIAVFCRQLYTMLNAGITIVNCLDILRMQTENQRLRESLIKIYEDVQTGVSFSEALEKTVNVFPELFISMVEAGEASGNLDSIVHRMALHYDKEAKLNAKVGNAMIYPLMLMLAIIIVVIIMLVKVLPMFVTMFSESGVLLPLPTRALIAMSGSLRSNWFFYLLGIAIFSYIFNVFSRTDTGGHFIDGAKLKLPIFGKPINKIITARFTRTLSTLMSSGIPLIHALEITSKIVKNRAVEEKLLDAMEQVKRGVDLSTPIRESGIFGPMVYSMIMVGEESGALDDILEKTADFYDDEVEIATQTLVSFLEPIMIIIMAVIIGAILISIYLPMFDIIQTVQ